MLAVTGLRSRIIEELRTLLPEGEEVVRCGPKNEFIYADRYVLCAGLLRPLPLEWQSNEQMLEGVWVNLLTPMALCESVLGMNDNARICVIGSESGFTWSYDGVYAASKAALHKYVETKRLKPNQQLVCVAPSIIGDAKMTLDRKDTDNLERRRLANPKQRFLTSLEVARMIHFLLYVDDGYTTGTVIRMNGGLSC